MTSSSDSHSATRCECARTVDIIHARDLVSALRPGLTAADRLDPYWDHLWSDGSSLAWRSHESATAQVIAGFGGLPAAHRISEAEAWTRLESSKSRNDLLRFLAVLQSFRTVTGEQIEALSSARGAANIMSGLVAALFRVGIIELGSAASGLMREATSKRATLYRPTNSQAVERIIERLTYAEWVSLTGGWEWDKGGQFDRHNVLATELGLRLAEYCDVATVLGEKFSTVDLLAGSGIGWKPMTGDTKSADLTVIRPDALKVAVELTATLGASFEKKVDRWARILNDRPMNESGLAVVFVVAPSHGSSARKVLTTTYKAIAAVSRRFPGTVRESIATRIGVVSWTDWFPARHSISTDFFTMTVNMPTGMADGHMVWTRTNLLDAAAYPFTPASPALTAILDNMHMLWGTPHWLRDFHKAPSLIPLVLGHPINQIPHTTRKPEKPDAPKLGAAKGAAGATQFPKRTLPYM